MIGKKNFNHEKMKFGMFIGLFYRLDIYIKRHNKVIGPKLIGMCNKP